MLTNLHPPWRRRDEPPDRAPIDPDRVRRLPRHFAWADHRLREHLGKLSLEEIALLFFLHLAADRNGCSFWADATIAKKMGLAEGALIQARYALLSKGYIAYRFPLYQLLSICETHDHGRERDPAAPSRDRETQDDLGAASR